MRFASFTTDEGPILAVLVGDQWANLTAYDPVRYASLRHLLAAGPDAIQRVDVDSHAAPQLPTAGLQPLAPVPDPSKVLCVGRNYAEHAEEQGAALPSEPLIFAKAPSALCGDGHPVRLPAQSQQIDYEAELVVVVGRRGSHVRPEQAIEYVAGYCCGNDVTARDWQKGKPGNQWLLGKSFDTFAPLGPHFVTADEVGPADELRIRMFLNGQVVQDANTREMTYSIPALIAYISQVMTLEPGDLLFTGTPSGVGVARQPPVFVKPGDLMEVEIERIGRLTNRAIEG